MTLTEALEIAREAYDDDLEVQITHPCGAALQVYAEDAQDGAILKVTDATEAGLAVSALGTDGWCVVWRKTVKVTDYQMASQLLRDQ